MYQPSAVIIWSTFWKDDLTIFKFSSWHRIEGITYSDSKKYIKGVLTVLWQLWNLGKKVSSFHYISQLPNVLKMHVSPQSKIQIFPFMLDPVFASNHSAILQGCSSKFALIFWSTSILLNCCRNVKYRIAIQTLFGFVFKYGCAITAIYHT